MSAADRNVYRLQGALARTTAGLKHAHARLVDAIRLMSGADDDKINDMPVVAASKKLLNKPLGDVTREELIAMWLGKDDLESVKELLTDLDEGHFTYANYDDCIRQFGALRRLLEG